MKTAPPAEVLYTPDEVAELWRCSRDTVERRIGSGALRAVNIGDGKPKIRVPASAVNEYVRRREIA